jgi:hypothetical protein
MFQQQFDDFKYDPSQLPNEVLSVSFKSISVTLQMLKLQFLIVFDVTYKLHLSNQSKTNKSSSISISIKFHKYFMLHTPYINQKQTIISNLNFHQISSIFDVTYKLHLSNQSNQRKTIKSSSISILIKFHKYSILHTYYTYQINQINQINENKQIIISLNTNQIL